MNIFYLDRDAELAARYHCNKHVCKMVLEYAQLLSTAHRVLDGVEETVAYVNEAGKQRAKKVYLLPGESTRVVPEKPYVLIENRTLYKATHVNHPCNIWVRATSENYEFLYALFVHCLVEYRVRYHRGHSVTRLLAPLAEPPRNLVVGEFYDPPLAMPEELKLGDVVTSYRRLYIERKARFARWTNREPPEWFTQCAEENGDQSRNLPK